MTCLASRAAAAQLEGPPVVTVARNVQVSVEHGDLPHRELRVCVNPHDANDLFTISEAYIPAVNGRSVRGYRSRDGGTHWRAVLEDLSKVVVGDMMLGEGDPECTYGADGTLYGIFLGLAGHKHGDSTVAYIHRMPPDSTTWLEMRLPFHDRPFMSVDLSNGPSHGTVYLGDNNSGTPRSPDLYRSRDGIHFVGPTQVPYSWPPSYQYAMPGESVVLLDGTVVVPRVLYQFSDSSWTYALKGRIDVVLGTDEGTRLSNSIPVKEWSGRTCFILGTSVAQDQSDGPYRGRVYLAWSGLRGDHCEILVAHSDDRGHGWSAPVTLTQDVFRSAARPGGDHDWPSVAVNRMGIVGVVWYDRRDDPDPAADGYVIRFAASRDGGETFGGGVQVSESHVRPLHPLQFGVWTTGADAGAVHLPGEHATDLTLHLTDPGGPGDTNGMRVDASGVFHPAWIDNRTGVAQIWTARIAVEGAAVLHGAHALAALDDVTGKVSLVVTRVEYDSQARRVSADVALRNESDSVLRAPLMVRVMSIVPAMIGTPSVVGADNGETGVAAIWDFSGTAAGALAPSSTSRPRRITLHLSPEQWGTIHVSRNEGWRGDDPAMQLFGSLAFRVYGRDHLPQ